MRTIGITGGVGSGKTKVLAYIKDKYNCEVILADEVAHKIKEPGERCYSALVDLLGQGVLAPDGKIDKGKMAEKIFEQLYDLVNENCGNKNIIFKGELLEKESVYDLNQK